MATKTFKIMLQFIQSAFSSKSVCFLTIMGLILLTSCGGSGTIGGRLKVKEDIIIEDCIKIPKQNVSLTIAFDADDAEYDLVAELTLENIKQLTEADFDATSRIKIGLLDKDDIELITLMNWPNKSLLTTKGKKAKVQFGLPFFDSDRTEENLKQIKENAKTILLVESDIMR